MMIRKPFVRSFAKLALNDTFIIDAVRTPIGSFRGSLSSIPATKLGSIAISALIKRTKIKPIEINEVMMGNVCQANLGQSPARQASIGAGVPSSVDCTTINKVCASGMKSVMLAAQSIMINLQDVMIAGGMENMSRVPFYLNRGELPYGGFKVEDGIVVDGLTDAYNKIHMGLCGEMLAKKMNISRKEQDDYASMSYERSLKAIQDGTLKNEIVEVVIPQKKGAPDLIMSEDEEPKRGDPKKISKLSPAFDKSGTITAANASKINDGAAALLLASRKAVESLNLKPMARIIAFADAALDPVDFTMAPSVAIPKLLSLANLKISDIDLWEINEAFSVVAIGNVKKLHLDIDRVNVNGGAVSMGHPIGMSGARIVGHLVHILQKGQKGVAAICNGGGAASSILIEKL